MLIVRSSPGELFSPHRRTSMYDVKSGPQLEHKADLSSVSTNQKAADHPVSLESNLAQSADAAPTLAASNDKEIVATQPITDLESESVIGASHNALDDLVAVDTDESTTECSVDNDNDDDEAEQEEISSVAPGQPIRSVDAATAQSERDMERAKQQAAKKTGAVVVDTDPEPPVVSAGADKAQLVRAEDGKGAERAVVTGARATADTVGQSSGATLEQQANPVAAQTDDKDPFELLATEMAAQGSLTSSAVPPDDDPFAELEAMFGLHPLA
jgi:hypothetical protein